MYFEYRIHVGKSQQLAYERARAGIFHVSILRLRLGMQQNQFTDAGTVNGVHSAEIKNHLAAILEKFSSQARKGCCLVAIDDAALAVNNHDIATIPSFQT